MLTRPIQRRDGPRRPGASSTIEAGKERLTRDTLRDATRMEIEQIKRENAELKQLAAELYLGVYRLKKGIAEAAFVAIAIRVRGALDHSTVAMRSAATPH